MSRHQDLRQERIGAAAGQGGEKPSPAVAGPSSGPLPFKPMIAAARTIDVRIKAVVYEAEDILAYELRHVDEEALPPFTAGAHVEVPLENGLLRHYSLSNAPSETDRYVIAVARDRASRGGSRFVHETWRAGSIIRIGPPRNNFPLHEDAHHSLLIAGGIGITPILSMVRRLSALGRSWDLRYCVRTRRHAAFRDELRAMGSRVRFVFDQEPRQAMLDIAATVGAAPAGTHFYCCGPASMMRAFEEATKGVPQGYAHCEYFSPKAVAPASGSFTVELARTGLTLVVPEDKSILDVILEAGVAVAYSCQEGVCGTCEARVMAGVPEHRDSVLTESERASGKTMMICCSRSRGGHLVLDL